MLTLQAGQFLRVQYAAPGKDPVSIGVMIFDVANDTVLMQFTSDFVAYAGDDSFILQLLVDDLAEKGHAMGGAALLRYLLDTLSNSILITDPELVYAVDLREEVSKRFEQELTPTTRSPALKGLVAIPRSRRVQVGVRLSMAAAGILLAVLVNRGIWRLGSVKPQLSPLAEGRQSNVTTVTKMPSAASVTAVAKMPSAASAGKTHVALRNKFRRSIPARHFAVVQRGFVLPASTLDPERPQPTLLDPSLLEAIDVTVAAGSVVALAEDAEVEPAAPKDPRSRRILQALTLPFRKLGRMLVE